MLETNLRIVKPGADLCLNVRCAEVVTQELSADLMQKACNILSKRHGLAAVISADRKKLLVATRRPVPRVELKGDDWHLEVKDADCTQELRFGNFFDQQLLAQLVERALVAKLAKDGNLWTFDSMRIWYEPMPFKTLDGVAAYNRYEVTAVAIDGVGIGISIDIGTAFYSQRSVADYFVKDISKEEQERLQAQFERLSARQNQRKGTLKYDFGKNKHKCYFDSFMSGTTAATPGILRVQGETYTSLQDYYKRKHGIEVDADEPVAKVSFRGIDRAQQVLARSLTLSVGNEALPGSLKQEDKLDPQLRHDQLERFWKSLGNEPLGREMPQVENRFWRPPQSAYQKIQPPALVFADGRRVEAPRDNTLAELKAYYRERLLMLDKVGCLYVPPAVKRTLYVAVPEWVPEDVALKLAEDIAARLSQWTRKEISPELILYKDVDDALTRLRRSDDTGVVLFVFDSANPLTYFHLAYELKDWRIKRITSSNLRKQTRQMQFSNNGHGVTAAQVPKGWNSFIEMNALDLLQAMDCVPWSLAEPLDYEAQLVIDVGADRRYFALSLLICRPDDNEPFRLETVVHAKSDHKHETINEVILCDEIIKLCKRVGTERGRFTPLNSLLVLRDGRDCGRELQAIKCAQTKLAVSGFLTQEAKVHMVDVHKRSVKNIRLWDRGKHGEVRHCLEGTALMLDSRTVVLVNTGAATLTQGTAEPVMLVAGEKDVDMSRVAAYFHATSQLNWSSPKVAQRLSIALKRTDDELKNRASQEMRRAS